MELGEKLDKKIYILKYFIFHSKCFYHIIYILDTVKITKGSAAYLFLKIKFAKSTTQQNFYDLFKSKINKAHININ